MSCYKGISTQPILIHSSAAGHIVSCI